jgi:energy-coupling factor transporter ATP-binding protein EcfA2
MDSYKLAVSGGDVLFSDTTKLNLILPANLVLSPGEVHLITGKNGSGKSTLLRVISNISSYDDGISSHTLEIKATSAEGSELKITGNTSFSNNGNLRVGYVAQAPRANFMSDNIKSELRIALEHALPNSLDVKKKLDELSSVAETFEYQLDQSFDELSDGRLQFLAVMIQRWLEPEILILDEPTAALDDIAAKQFIQDIKECVGSNTNQLILISTQDQRLSEEFDSLVTSTIELSKEPIPNSAPLKITKSEAEQNGKPISLSSSELLLNTDQPNHITCHFDWYGGEIIQIVGNNGIGKTTFLEALSGFSSSRVSGHKVINGYLQDISKTIFPPTLAYCFQRSIEQIVFETARIEIEFLKTLKIFDSSCLENAVRGIPLDVPVSRLSYGQKKYIALLAMVGRSDILLMDEPFGSLDHDFRESLQVVLRAFVKAGGLLVISESHRTVLNGFEKRTIFRLDRDGLKHV